MRERRQNGKAWDLLCDVCPWRRRRRRHGRWGRSRCTRSRRRSPWCSAFPSLLTYSYLSLPLSFPHTRTSSSRTLVWPPPTARRCLGATVHHYILRLHPNRLFTSAMTSAPRCSIGGDGDDGTLLCASADTAAAVAIAAAARGIDNDDCASETTRERPTLFHSLLLTYPTLQTTNNCAVVSHGDTTPGLSA